MYPEGPATGHLELCVFGFSFKQMLRLLQTCQLLKSTSHGDLPNSLPTLFISPLRRSVVLVLNNFMLLKALDLAKCYKIKSPA